MSLLWRTIKEKEQDLPSINMEQDPRPINWKKYGTLSSGLAIM